MFTGLVLGKGKIVRIERQGTESRLTIDPQFRLNDYQPGESIAVNGTCLTVEAYSGNRFSAYASAETMSRTNLNFLKTGSSVNLERALALGDRLGGHMVSGHVDCLAEVSQAGQSGESYVYRLIFPKEYGSQVIEKGSVALDGISLTVNACGADFLEVNIIPVTRKETTIFSWKPGTVVNMETDLIGKYVQKMITPWSEASKSDAGSGQSKITMDFLQEHGFG